MLRFSQRGFLELVSYLEEALMGSEPDEETRLRGNEFLAESDRAQQEFIILLDRTSDCSPS